MPGFIQLHTNHILDYHLATFRLDDIPGFGESPPGAPRGPGPGEPSASPTAEAAKIACLKQALPKALFMGATSQPRKYSQVLAGQYSVSTAFCTSVTIVARQPATY